MVASLETPRVVVLCDEAHQPWLTQPVTHVVYRGDRSVVLGVGDELVALTDERLGLLPGGISFRSTEDFVRFVALAPRLPGGLLGSALLTHGAVCENVSLRLDSRAIEHPVVDALAARFRQPLAADSGESLSRQARQAGFEGPDLATGSGWRLAEGVRGLIGLGPGATPSGDDVLVGVLAGFRIAGQRCAAERVGACCSALLHRTTRTSQHFLRHAARGHFAEQVHTCSTALGRPGDPDAIASDLMRLASAWGAHSGIDLLAGLAAALQPHQQDKEAA